MSWLARSVATSLTLDDTNDSNDGDGSTNENDVVSHQASPAKRNQEETEIDDEELHHRGVKEDLTELKQTLTRQFWGVASFLAPPPAAGSDDRVVASNLDQSQPSDRSQGRTWDSGGIGERFRSGVVTEISKMASDYFPFGSEENERESREENEESDGDWGEGVIGITDEVLAFARNIAMHPETWLDFPLDEDEDLDDFLMSGAQREHALAIERLAPRLAALRIELCPCHMTESYFWKVYFVLLHSRLNKHDAEILSTPQVMEARAMWMQELHKQMKPESDWLGSSTLHVKNASNVLHEDFDCARTTDNEQTTSTTMNYETEKQAVVNKEIQFIDKSVIEEKPVIKSEDKDLLVGPSSKILVPNYEDDDDWPDEEDSDLGGYKTTLSLGNDEDISFSDLEDDASGTIPIKSKTVPKGTETS